MPILYALFYNLSLITVSIDKIKSPCYNIHILHNFIGGVNMKFKWRPDHFKERFPLHVYRNGNTYYFHIQHEVVGFNHYSFGEYDKITTDDISEMGSMAQKLLNRFHEISRNISDETNTLPGKASLTISEEIPRDEKDSDTMTA